MKRLLTSLIAAAALAGCATPDANVAAEPSGAREYPTGSNIPRKSRPGEVEGVKTYSREELERARAQQVQTPRPGLGGSP